MIVVDDGSVDDSRAVIDRYATRIVPVLKENGGQASAINAGFARSRGDVVIFLDADDVLRPEIGARVVETLGAQSDAGKVEYRLDIIDDQGRRTGGMKPAEYLERPSGDLRQYELQSPFEVLWMSTSGNAFSRRVLEQILPVPEAGYPVCGADWYLAHISPFFGPVVFLDDIGGSYRVHDANLYNSSQLDLNQVRQSIVFMCTTLGYIAQTARAMGVLPGRRQHNDILSFSYFAHRMISLKLDPQRHPGGVERRMPLIWLGAASLARRFDISLPLKLAMFAWLASVAVAPRALAWQLSEQFMVPESRPVWVNSTIQRMHRRATPSLLQPQPERIALSVR